MREEATELGWPALLAPRLALPLSVLLGGVLLHSMNVLVTATLLPSIVADVGGSNLVSWPTTAFVASSMRPKTPVGSPQRTVESGGEPTIRYCMSNDDFAPIPDLPDPSPEGGRSTHGGRSTYINQKRRTVPLDRGLLGTGASYVAPFLTGFTPGRDNRAELASRG